MRKFMLLAALAVLAWVFVVPGCSDDFGCAAVGVARAADERCPSSVGEAGANAKWAADRLESIKEQRRTTALFYDEDGNEERLSSGSDATAEKAAEVLREVGAPASPISTYPAATHVEVKAAVAMRDGELKTGVMVINNEAGPCPGELGCVAAVPLVLPTGASLVVWWPSDAGMKSQQFTGGQG